MPAHSKIGETTVNKEKSSTTDAGNLDISTPISTIGNGKKNSEPISDSSKKREVAVLANSFASSAQLVNALDFSFALVASVVNIAPTTSVTGLA